MFIGEYRYSIDEKGRLFLPGEYKKIFGDELVIAKGMEKCLFLYTLSEWDDLVKRVSALGFTKKSNREFTRLFLSGAFKKEIDNQGRVKIDKILLDHAEITKECAIIGAGTRAEIWDKLRWDEHYNNSVETLDEISENLDLDE